MNLLINQPELVGSLARHLLKKQLLKGNFDWSTLNSYVAECRAEYCRSQHIVIDFNYVNKLINKEINRTRQELSADFKQQIKKLTEFLVAHEFYKHIPTDYLIDLYCQDSRNGFIKSVGQHLTDQPCYITNLTQADLDQPFLIRNIVNNEAVLEYCLTRRHPFWFIDSGYTNFLHGKNKIWHRLVRNHIHHGIVNIEYPDDRLKNLTVLPPPWRKKGRTILVVESSENHYAMRGTTLEAWRRRIRKQLRQHTDRPIEFRSKEASRKTRSTVYSLLQDTKEYHCVVSDSSSAAIEAVWSGVPAVTLERHISNSVSSYNLAEIETLYRGDIEPWLRAVSYNQFTFEELCDGTAVSIARTYGTI